MQYAQVENVSRLITKAVLSGHCTYSDLASRLGTEDLYDILEIEMVHSYNQMLASKKKPEDN